MLFSGDRPTCGDPTHQRDVHCLLRLYGIFLLNDFKGPTFGGVLANKALFDQGIDLVADRGGGGEAGGSADLAHGWRVALGGDRLFNHVEDQFLA